MPSKIAVFHPGTQHSWQTALALQQLDRLQFYATSIFYVPDRWPYRAVHYVPAALRNRALAEFRRVHHPGLDPARVVTTGSIEWFERIANRFGYRRTARWLDRIGNRRFAHALAGRIAAPEPFGLWGFNGSSRDAFEGAKRAGRLCILDRTTGDWRTYNRDMNAVFDRYREFFLTAEYRVPQWQIDRDDAEYASADMILVGSEFAAGTIRREAADRAAAERVRVLNYCFDEYLFGALPPPVHRSHSGPVRFLVLGQPHVRKGIHLILDAFARIPASAATLTIVGDLQIPRAVFARYADRVVHRPTVPRPDVPAIMAQADVLLFPSYFEGSALSLIEGLAAGLALIQTPNAGEGVTPECGLLMPEVSEQALYDAVMATIEDRHRLDAWRAAAQGVARRYTFANYRSGIATLLDKLDLAS
jgi:glycosyltransferase involved in cell wall biosynthesis